MRSCTLRRLSGPLFMRIQPVYLAQIDAHIGAVHVFVVGAACKECCVLQHIMPHNSTTILYKCSGRQAGARAVCGAPSA